MGEKIGFVGVGAMGSALLKGLINGGVNPDKIIATDVTEDKLHEAAGKYGFEAVADAIDVAVAARIIFLAVKPQDMKNMLKSIASAVTDEHLLVSVAAGISTKDIEKRFDCNVGVIRVMPNTPCLVAEGAMALSGGKNVRDEDLKLVSSWLAEIGMVRVVPEKLMDAVTGLSGSGPAYVYSFIEALSDGGVLAGLPRELAAELAVQTVLGSAKMVMETGMHPAVLREMVTSPGGTTAAGLLELEAGGVRTAAIKAVHAAAERSKELGS